MLERGVDYEINYDLGQVTFNNPASLFPSGVGTVTARFEERGIFAVAPTSILGGTLGYSLGDVGTVDLVAMYQKEQSVFTRPTLGFEPTSNLLTGITTNLRFQVDGVTRFFDKLTSQQVTAPSRPRHPGGVRHHPSRSQRHGPRLPRGLRGGVRHPGQPAQLPLGVRQCAAVVGRRGGTRLLGRL